MTEIELMNELKNVRNIIFDMDGTLVDSSKVTIRACQETSLEFGFENIKAEEIIKLIGYPDPEFYYRMYPNLDKAIVNKYASEVAKKEECNMCELKEENLFPGVWDLIKTLKNNKFYLSVASTGSLAHVETALKTSGIYSEFESIHCNETFKVMMVEDIIKNGPKGNWLIIGDRENDFNAGRLNDIITIGAKYGFGTESELMKFDFNINYPGELLTLLSM